MIPPDARILDLGCGAGRDAAVFTGLGHWVAGMDLSMGMLLEANRRAPGSYLQGDMTRLPFAPESFDAAWLNASLLHLPRELAPGVLAGVQASAQARWGAVSQPKRGGKAKCGSSVRANASSPFSVWMRSGGC